MNMRIIYILIIYMQIDSEVHSQICPKVRKVPVTVPKTITENYTRTEKHWFGIERIIPVVEVVQYNETEFKDEMFNDCCDGYALMNSVCRPICEPPCSHGNCIAPNKCHCHDAYTKLNDSRCVHNCENCENGYCDATGICQCSSGFKKDENGTCKPVCPPGYADSSDLHICNPICDPPCGNGTCIQANTCECFDGYNNSTLGKNHRCVHNCENCENGYCDATGICQCSSGFKKDENGTCKPVCPPGYADSSDLHICNPICDPPCGNGTCIQPNTCECFDGYNNSTLRKNHRCVHNCENCENGYCDATGICQCSSGFKKDENGTCKPVCPPGYANSSDLHICNPICDPPCGNGTCIQPNTCECFDGYNNSTLRKNHRCVHNCENCENGYCDATGICQCSSGFKKDENGTCKPVCPPGYADSSDLHICNPICDPPCGNGTCIQANTCECFDGYNNSTLGKNHRCVHNCENCENGYCDATGICQCSSGFKKDENGTCKPVCPPGYADSSDLHICNPICDPPCGNGTCIQPNTCECFDGYNNSTLRKNHRCVHNCENCENGYCDATGICQCSSGFKKDENGTCKPVCPPGYADSSDLHICNPICDPPCGNGTCIQANTCECFDGYNNSTLGKNHRCVHNCENCENGYCDATGICQCSSGFKKDENGTCKPVCPPGYANSSDLHICNPICDPPCGNGTCIQPNTCECFDGYNNSTLRKNHRCVHNCENCENGYCDATGICQCSSGFKKDENGTCKPVCPPGYANSSDLHICNPICDPPCGNGTCIQPNTCECFDGYNNSTLRKNHRCVHNCENCENGYCDATGICQCSSGFKKDENGTCKPVCPPGYANSSDLHICNPICDPPCGNGTCIQPNTCECFDGYNNSTLRKNHRCILNCENCEYGYCDASGFCQCSSGFKKDENDTCKPVCPAGYASASAPHICHPICDPPCGNGTCIQPNTCQCFDGYTNSALHISTLKSSPQKDSKGESNTCQPKCEGFALNDTFICEPVCDIDCVDGFCSAPNTCTKSSLSTGVSDSSSGLMYFIYLTSIVGGMLLLYMITIYALKIFGKVNYNVDKFEKKLGASRISYERSADDEHCYYLV